MKWKKLGRIFCANYNSEKMVTGGQTPVPLHLDNNTYRIYFGAYDSQGRGNIYSLDIDITSPVEFDNLETKPIIEMGKIGFYDDNGIIPSAVLEHGNNIYLYTIGFSIKNKLLFDVASGIAISEDNGKNFDKMTGPVVDRTIYDPCFSTSPNVLYDSGCFKMWYVSCDHWDENIGNQLKHYYNIRYKESEDGIHWNIKSSIAIDFQNKHEYAIARPAVIKDAPDDYKMWYSFREQPEIKTYRIGYAESKDGIHWTRKDKLMKNFDVSNEGWDSEMICYPCVFDHEKRRYTHAG